MLNIVSVLPLSMPLRDVGIDCSSNSLLAADQMQILFELCKSSTNFICIVSSSAIIGKCCACMLCHVVADIISALNGFICTIDCMVSVCNGALLGG